MTNSLPRILITGGNGQLAQALRQHALTNKFQLSFRSHAEMDISNLHSVTTVIKEFSPDAIINTAAYTAVDKAESDEDAAMQANYQGAKNLAIASHEAVVPLIHLSTDYVFDGEATIPYSEEALTNPINIYGKSKYLGEEAIREHCTQHIILRVSGVFSEFGNNFFKTILRLAAERNELRIVADQMTCPTDANDIARVIFNLLAAEEKSFGTYHYCGKNAVSWHEFATAIISEAKKYKPLLVENIQAIPASAYPTPARRPAYSVFNCKKIENHFGITQTPLAASIQQVAAVLLQRS